MVRPRSVQLNVAAGIAADVAGFHWYATKDRRVTFAIDWTGTVIDILLPSTDRVVAIQWIVCALFWPAPLWWAHRQNRDLKHFIWGLAMMNLAWFALRTVH